MPNISAHFTLDELCRSATGDRHKVDNSPSAVVLANLTRLCVELLDPVRTLIGRPLQITSGYRCELLNTLVGGAKNSAHLEGLAVDLVCPGMQNGLLAQRIAEAGIAFDQLILEEYRPPTQNGWVHLALSSGRNRQQVLTKRAKSHVYLQGIVV